ncbi:NFX1-type zinc finger-containing protein 1-like [Macrosteles quadrilineatus]|uniref:NFX1-type zinc finger-containing protein 1-like n=1 Tax=Macrosteles quadrilineatus TaxID=74068 RepID=UPI0023E0FC0F|nr:NFX1-type zinc finger-containing protein 1-like [Macrosteles quadrilineatus]XP_054273693.1 NFX1-type zinc finger-containing protein 1-like [Macrosteles quadrilineatus]
MEPDRGRGKRGGGKPFRGNAGRQRHFGGNKNKNAPNVNQHPNPNQFREGMGPNQPPPFTGHAPPAMDPRRFQQPFAPPTYPPQFGNPPPRFPQQFSPPPPQFHQQFSPHQPPTHRPEYSPHHGFYQNPVGGSHPVFNENRRNVHSFNQESPQMRPDGLSRPPSNFDFSQPADPYNPELPYPKTDERSKQENNQGRAQREKRAPRFNVPRDRRSGTPSGHTWNSETNLHRVNSVESLKSEKSVNLDTSNQKSQNRGGRKRRDPRNSNNQTPNNMFSNPPEMGADMSDNWQHIRRASQSNDIDNISNYSGYSQKSETHFRGRGNMRARGRGRGNGARANNFERPQSRNSSTGDFVNDFENLNLTMESGLGNKQSRNIQKNRRGRGKNQDSKDNKSDHNEGGENIRLSLSDEDNTNLSSDTPTDSNKSESNQTVGNDNIESGAQQQKDKSKKNQRKSKNKNNTAQMKSNEQVSNITVEQLENLKKQDPLIIIEILSAKESEFGSIFQDTLEPDILILAVEVLSKICESPSSQMRAEVLRQASLPSFADQLFTCVTEFPYLEDEKMLQQVNQFFENTILFYETLADFMPSAVRMWHNHVVEVQKSLKIMTKNPKIELNCNLVSMAKNLLNEIGQNLKEDVEKPKESRNEKKKEKYFPEPVGNFRTVSLYPRPEDVYEEQPFLYPNIIQGPYQSVEHYLDIHFKLLREDFMSPIRQAMRVYKKQCNTKDRFKRVDNVRIYRKVKFLHSKTVLDTVGYEVCFDVDKKINRVNWEFSNRFMYGSLLLFTNDNFDSFFLATVANRNVKELQDKLVTVELVQNPENVKSILGKEFIMAESEAYFNPYFHVLKALQRFNETNFPLGKYIVEVSTETEPPRYLGFDDQYVINGLGQTFGCRVLDYRDWPTPEQLGLDPSQYGAFRAALTNDLTVIQGPPGTGKTFLGLKIAHALLKNAHVWNENSTPIFVVCFTNHALDQFLEGLLPVTTKLVRIGGKSKGSELDKFNIRERRREHSYYKKAQGREIRDLKLKMSTVFKDIQVYQSNLRALEHTTGVVSLATLKLVMGDEQRNYFSGDEDFLDWLLEGVAGSKEKDKVKITITADRGVVREAPKVDPLVADAEDLRVKQAFFDTIDLDLNVGPSEDTVIVQFACVLDNLAKKYDQLSQQLGGKNKLHRSQLLQISETKNSLGLTITHLRKELVEAKKCPRSVTEKFNLQEQRYLRGLKPDERWRLYHSWIEILRDGLTVTLGQKDTEYKDYSYRYEQMRQSDDLQILRTANVVGTTTTLAAKFQPMFEALAPRIVIVEEAAEVLEAHIIASLSKSCEHLILIGDHKQLRPSVAETRMARQYHLDVSLFERLVLNDMACHTLTLQHRMRPEISKQLVPTIYPLLRDDPSVLDRPSIRGMDKNVFFMTHNHFEDEVVEITSKRNRFEAEILLNLAKYLVQQGYKPQDITILATYKGQMYHMKSEIKNMTGFPKGIQITVVDNFQGEENKIILLSMVRSNAVNKIGFLEIENRICVALSRARDGLYIVGNMNCLVANSDIWARIRNSLTVQQSYGPALFLRCQIHQEQKTMIQSAKDFSKVSEGGCSLLCGQPLACGHSCKSMCHVEQDYHKRYKCKEACSKVLCAEGHMCPKKCHQPCGDCQIPMRRQLPCGHSADVPCHKDIRTHQCEQPVEVRVPSCRHIITVQCHTRHFPVCSLPCTRRLDCGHSCEMMCHETEDPDHLEYVCRKPCARLNAGCTKDHKCPLLCVEPCNPCSEMVIRELPCKHLLKLACSADLNSVLCQQKCAKTLPCSHRCTKKCFQNCGPCDVQVEKTVIGCRHMVKVECSTPATRQICTGRCPNEMRCGHQCAKRCKDECSVTDCEVLVPVKEKKTVFGLSVFSKKLYPLLCGHSEAHVPCNKKQLVDQMSPEELMKYCQNPCGQVLNCKHRCSGTCSECMQGRIHKVCTETCGNVLVCGHSCKVNCREVCPPCKEPCRHECKHSKCSRKCGEECVSCKEPCDYSCPHLKCLRRCGELCDRDPCYESCPQRLSCGHSCVGFCGEPCPPCRQCEPKHFEEIFYTGEETEEDSKWVLLVDCGHTLESTGLEMWLNIEQDGGEIGCKVCPRCKSPIVQTQRFMNLIKKTYMDIQQVKAKCFGKRDEISRERAKALRRIQQITFQQMSTRDQQMDDELQKMYLELLVELPDVKGKKRNTIDTQRLHLLCFWTEFFISVYSRKLEVWSKLFEEGKILLNANINCITKLLMKRRHKISEQEMECFQREVKRIHRIADLLVYVNSAEYRMAASNSIVKETRKAAEHVIFSISAYDDVYDEVAKHQLEKLKTLIRSSSEVTAAERSMINQAMSSSFRSAQKTGHWFKCKNGHLYCITECGGAMEVAICPVRGCGQKIGGQNHQLLEGQDLASEMDGARYAAWSDANNMANFNF